MVEMSLAEAQLFRLLVGFFGTERVVWSMSTRAVCGGELLCDERATYAKQEPWPTRDKCLFTVVDYDNMPKMVVEFSPDFSNYIEVEQLERQQHLPRLLEGYGIQYVTISNEELGEIVDPNSTLDFVTLLQDKIGV